MSLVTVADLKLRIRSSLFYYDGDTAMPDERLQLHLDRAISMLATASASQGGELVAPLPQDAIGHICNAAAYFVEVDKGYNPELTGSLYRLLYDDFVAWCDKVSKGLLFPLGVPTRSNATAHGPNGAAMSIGSGVGTASRLGVRRGW